MNIRFQSKRDDTSRYASQKHVIPFTKKQAIVLAAGLLCILAIGILAAKPVAEFLNYRYGIGNKAAIQKVEIEDLKDIHDTVGRDSYTVHFVYNGIISRDRNDKPPDDFKEPYMWVTFTYRVDDGGIKAVTEQLQQLKGVEPNGVNVKTFSVSIRKADEMKWIAVWQEVRMCSMPTCSATHIQTNSFEFQIQHCWQPIARWALFYFSCSFSFDAASGVETVLPIKNNFTIPRAMSQ